MTTSTPTNALHSHYPHNKNGVTNCHDYQLNSSAPDNGWKNTDNSMQSLIILFNMKFETLILIICEEPLKASIFRARTTAVDVQNIISARVIQ
jgi:hypothetical protein